MLSPSNSATQTLHPLLQNARGGQIICDVTRPLNPIMCQQPAQLHEPALYPPALRLHIKVPGHSTWAFDVENTQGITLQDVLSTIHRQLHRGLSHSDFLKLTEEEQAGAYQSLQRRAVHDPVLFHQGVKRLDFIYPRLRFAGLTRDSDGSSWNLNFISGY